MKLVLQVSVLCAVLSGCCANSPFEHSRDGFSIMETSRFEAISFDSRLLLRPEIPSDRLESMENDLQAARGAYDAAPQSEEAIIWYGRRLAYLGRYRDAIAVYRAGLDFHPDSFRLRRHLGHRLITVREIDHAIAVLERAGQFIDGVPDEIEPDGQPNPQNLPRSTTHFNIWYHLALAKYLHADFTGAAEAWQRCLDVSTNDDSIVAASYWLYLALMREGDKSRAISVLERIGGEMEIIENHAYHALLLMYQGRRTAEELLTGAATELDQATIGYGAAMQELLRGDESEAMTLMERVVAETNWASFGHIAAEAELARRLQR